MTFYSSIEHVTMSKKNLSILGRVPLSFLLCLLINFFFFAGYSPICCIKFKLLMVRISQDKLLIDSGIMSRCTIVNYIQWPNQ